MSELGRWGLTIPSDGQAPSHVNDAIKSHEVARLMHLLPEIFQRRVEGTIGRLVRLGRARR
jgi:hypothetical protein